MDMKNVHYAIRPFYFVSKILGTFAYSYEGPYYNGDLKLSVPGALWCGLLVVIYISVFVVSMFIRESINSTSKILALAWATSSMISFTTILIAKFYQMGKQKSIKNFIKSIDEVDANVRYERKVLKVSIKLCSCISDSLAAAETKFFKAADICDCIAVDFVRSPFLLFFHFTNNVLRPKWRRNNNITTGFHVLVQLCDDVHDFLLPSVLSGSHDAATPI